MNIHLIDMSRFLPAAVATPATSSVRPAELEEPAVAAAEEVAVEARDASEDVPPVPGAHCRQ
jgi:hypothetical protein